MLSGEVFSHEIAHLLLRQTHETDRGIFSICHLKTRKNDVYRIKSSVQKIHRCEQNPDFISLILCCLSKHPVNNISCYYHILAQTWKEWKEEWKKEGKEEMGKK